MWVKVYHAGQEHEAGRVQLGLELHEVGVLAGVGAAIGTAAKDAVGAAVGAAVREAVGDSAVAAESAVKKYVAPIDALAALAPHYQLRVKVYSVEAPDPETACPAGAQAQADAKMSMDNLHVTVSVAGGGEHTLRPGGKHAAPTSPVDVDADFGEAVLLEVPDQTGVLTVQLKDGDGGHDGSLDKGRDVGLGKLPLAGGVPMR